MMKSFCRSSKRIHEDLERKPKGRCHDIKWLLICGTLAMDQVFEFSKRDCTCNRSPQFFFFSFSIAISYSFETRPDSGPSRPGAETGSGWIKNKKKKSGVTRRPGWYGMTRSKSSFKPVNFFFLLKQYRFNFLKN